MTEQAQDIVEDIQDNEPEIDAPEDVQDAPRS